MNPLPADAEAKVPTVDPVVETTVRNTYGTWRFQKGWKPLHVVEADGCWFKDASGKKYLDFSSQLICTNLGFRNEALAEAIARQAREMPYLTPALTCDIRAELARELLGVLPAGLEKFFFSTSGAEAIEAAIKIARLYTGRHKIIARYTSYHGSTSGAIAATGDFRRWPVEPVGKVPGVLFGPECNCYRCPLGKDYPGCSLACADYLDYMIQKEGNVAAILVEPIVGTNGALVPPDDYLPRVEAIARRHGVLLIADEVMTGFGRTGKWFAVDHWGVKPDILVSAKGLTAAFTPLGLTATTRAIADYFEDHYFAHGHTYEAHPLAMAPAVAAIREYRSRGLVERVAKLGERLGERLRALGDRHRSVGDVRGRGFLWAVDLVRNRQTKEPFNLPEDKVAGRPLVVDRVVAEMMKRGVSTMGWISHILMAPPFIVSEEEIDLGVRALDEALAVADAEVR
jgi:taurine--2-oxoglutarate transaminase